jgi:lipoprotein-anchoring transpeptidase ErfK/SrfK
MLDATPELIYDVEMRHPTPSTTLPGWVKNRGWDHSVSVRGTLRRGVPDTIGRAGSHGSIRLSNWDDATFYTLVGKGTAVTIR